MTNVNKHIGDRSMSFFRQIKSIINKPEPVSETTPATPLPPPERRQRRRLVHKGRKILIVDDSATIVASLGSVLKSAGCKVSGASSAEAGIEQLRSDRPDLVFLDIILPGMNGFAALRLIRRDPLVQDIPIIMISGNEQATEQFYAKRIGADDFMKKPFSRYEVFAHIDALVAAGKLPQLTNGGAPAQTSAPPRPAQKTANLSNETIAQMTQLEARRHLAEMGLQYFSQEQFSAAIKRGDKLAVDLFIIGGGVEITA